MARSDLCEHVQRAVRDLSAPYREVIWLRYMCEYPADAVAAILNRPLNTVRSQVRRGGIRLRQALATLELD